MTKDELIKDHMIEYLTKNCTNNPLESYTLNGRVIPYLYTNTQLIADSAMITKKVNYIETY